MSERRSPIPDHLKQQLEYIERKVEEARSYEVSIAGDAAVNKWLEKQGELEAEIDNFLHQDEENT